MPFTTVYVPAAPDPLSPFAGLKTSVFDPPGQVQFNPGLLIDIPATEVDPKKNPALLPLRITLSFKPTTSMANELSKSIKSVELTLAGIGTFTVKEIVMLLSQPGYGVLCPILFCVNIAGVPG